MKCVNIKLWDILGCFHYILNAPRRSITLMTLPGTISVTNISSWLMVERRKLPYKVKSREKIMV